MMNAMKKFSIALERYLDILAQARVESALRSLGRDPWRFSDYSPRPSVQPRLVVSDGRRTTSVHANCTGAEHADPATDGVTAPAASEPPRTAA